MNMETPTLRRNGKRPSCEPCRKSKLSCDHTTPICGRCVRRKIPDKCTYHPAPMTGLKSRDRPDDPRRPFSSPKPTQRSPMNSKPEIVNASSSPIVHHRPSWVSDLAPQQPTPNSDRSDWRIDVDISRLQTSQNPYPGFLGSTSFSAPFDESKNEIDLSSDSDAPPLEQFKYRATQEHQRRVKDGAAVLAQISNYEEILPIINRWREYTEGLYLLGPWIESILKSVKTDLIDKYLINTDEKGALAASELLLANSLKPLRIPSTCKVDGFADLFTGGRIRWETVGALLIATGLACHSLGHGDPLLAFVGQNNSEKQSFIHRMTELSSTCLSFCIDAGHLNDLGVVVLHEHCILVSQSIGDAHYLTWRRLGDLSTAMFAMGLHQPIRDSPEVPFWLTEFRRRCVGVIYGIDKMIAIFVGRPPRISHRYCSVPYPLDLDMEEITVDGLELQKNLATIKENGWNKDGKLRKASHNRAFVIISRIREDILELSLGQGGGDVQTIVADITERNKEAWDNFPQSLKYSPEIWYSSRAADDCVTTIIVYLDLVYNEFILQRTLVRRTRAQSDELIRVSRLLLSTVLTVINNRNQCGAAGCDISWIVVLFGLPASGVLALELLQQTQSRAHFMKDFPRSEIIQNLSVFVSSLGWVHNEGDGNYHLCIQAKNMIQRILDRVLSPESCVSSQQTMPTPSDSNFAEDAIYDFSWMDNAQFDSNFWSNLDFHPLLALPDGAI